VVGELTSQVMHCVAPSPQNKTKKQKINYMYFLKSK
jgi:hypothetical protein